MLVRPIRAVADRTTETADQKFFEADQLQVHVGTPFHTCQVVFGIVIGVMVSGHIKQGDIQHRQQIFKVRVRQVTTTEDQLDIAKVTSRTKSVEPVDHLIAHCKDFHNVVLCRRTMFLAREGISNFVGLLLGCCLLVLYLKLMYETEMLRTDRWLSKEAGQTIIDKLRRRTTGNKDIS